MDYIQQQQQQQQQAYFGCFPPTVVQVGYPQTYGNATPFGPVVHYFEYVPPVQEQQLQQQPMPLQQQQQQETQEVKQVDPMKVEKKVEATPVVDDDLFNFLDDVFEPEAVDVCLEDDIFQNESEFVRAISSDSSSVFSTETEANNSDSEGEKSARIFYRRVWSKKEDALLTSLVKKFGAKNWSRLATYIPGKDGNQLSQRWQKALDSSIKKGKWSSQEDEQLKELVAKHGRKWKAISKLMSGRTGKQVRDRYTSRLDPKLVRTPWTPEEEKIVLDAYAKLGNKWASIQKLLPHRSWYTIKWRIEQLTKKA